MTQFRVTEVVSAVNQRMKNNMNDPIQSYRAGFGTKPTKNNMNDAIQSYRGGFCTKPTKNNLSIREVQVPYLLGI